MTQRNARRYLTADDVGSMRIMRAQGHTLASIAEKYGASLKGAHDAITGETWKGLEIPPVKQLRREETLRGRPSAVRARFENLYIPEPMSGCWLWLGKYDRNGYGRFKNADESVVASRASWAIFNGPIPDGMLALHKCDNPACANPGHLYIGTPQDNMRDLHERGPIRRRKKSWLEGTKP